MYNAEKRSLWKNRGKQILKVENEKWKEKLLIKKELHTIKKREKRILPLRKKLSIWS